MQKNAQIKIFEVRRDVISSLLILRIYRILSKA